MFKSSHHSTIEGWVSELKAKVANPPAHILRPLPYRVHIASAISLLESALRVWRENGTGTMPVDHIGEADFALVTESLKKASLCAFHLVEETESPDVSGVMLVSEQDTRSNKGAVGS